MPASVGAAYRRGEATEDDLLSGDAYRRMLESFGRAGSLLSSERVPRGPVDQASGYRHLLVLMALAIDEALRQRDPRDPYIAPGNVDSVLKWGMDCPDAAYSGAPVRPEGRYLVTGRRGSARYVGFQVMAGIASTANLVLDEIELGPDGTFEVTLSAEPAKGNWMPLSDDATSLTVRQFFYDWENEIPAEIHIERLDTSGSAAAAPVSAAGVASQLRALGEFVEASMRFWLDIEEAGRSEGLNCFREPANRTFMGGAAENVTVWGSWQLEPDQALLIEVAPPEALYWSVSLGNFWWETIDYANHQSSLNGHQAVVDDDGVFRAVVAHKDPGVANWLDTAGHHRGPAIFRWLRAEEAPVPQTRVVGLDEVAESLPPETAFVDSEQRQAAIASRRAGVRRRFGR
jgi:hypothetical protein